jgi:hypothetical protein
MVLLAVVAACRSAPPIAAAPVHPVVATPEPAEPAPADACAIMTDKLESYVGCMRGSRREIVRRWVERSQLHVAASQAVALEPGQRQEIARACQRAAGALDLALASCTHHVRVTPRAPEAAD